MYTLITGASTGIGKALALECASRGMNILLIALPGKELDILEKQVKERYDVTCNSLGVDLSVYCAPASVYNWVKENNYEVNILINNVGVGSKGCFGNISPDFYYTQINLNVTATCIMTRLFIDELKKNTPSHILNVGSMGGFFSLPEKVVYAATKAFVYSFSRGLRMELESSGIQVSVLCPGGTDTNKNTIASNKNLKGFAKFSVLQPEQVAREAINKMLRGQARIIPGYSNRFIYGLSRIMPGFLQKFFVRKAFRHAKKHVY